MKTKTKLLQFVHSVRTWERLLKDKDIFLLLYYSLFLHLKINLVKKCSNLKS